MHVPDDSTTSLQSLMRRTMLPWEYRHLRAVASVRFAAGGFTLALGLVLSLLGCIFTHQMTAPLPCSPS